MRLPSLLAATAATGLTLAAGVAGADVPALLPVQGYLTNATGVAFEGPTDVTIALYASETAAAPLYTETQALMIDGGYFTTYVGDGVALDVALFRDHPQLFVGVKIGTDAEMFPRAQLGVVPYAAVAQYAPWAGLSGVPPELLDGDQVGPSYAAGSGLTLSGTTFAVDPAVVQARVTGTCAAGMAVTAVGADGSVTCAATGTSYAAGSGLMLAGTTFSVDPAVVQARVTGSCPAGSAIQSIGAGGTVTCQADTNTTYAAGSGLMLAGTTFSVDPAVVQARVTGSCPAGSAIQSIGAGGTVTCQTDTNTTYAAGSGLMLAGTTFSVDPAVVQARVSGSCPAGQAIRAVGADGMVTCQAAGGDPTPDTIADDGVISDDEASDVLSINNGLLSAPSGGALVDVSGELRSNGAYQVGLGAPTSYKVSERRYVIDAGPSVVGRIVPIDEAILEALCRDLDGCDVTVEMVNWDAAQPGNVASRGERLYLSETSRWWRFTNNDVAGLDGNGALQEWAVWDCYFGDAETWTGVANGRADASAQWGLLNVAGGSYSDATTTCRVTIED